MAAVRVLSSEDNLSSAVQRIMRTRASSVFLSVLLIVFCFILLCSGSSRLDDGKNATDENAVQLFAAFVEKYERRYEDETERTRRFQIFKDTLTRIRQRNSAHHAGDETIDVPFGVTRYADLTPEEFRKTMLRHPNEDPGKINGNLLRHVRTRRAASIDKAQFIAKNLPKRMDWRDSKVVNPVRNQGECGACWAFSTVESLESMYALRTGHLPMISVQQVIDCAADGNYGCLGGDTCMALYWMNTTKVRLVNDKDYPFVHTTGTCKLQNSTKGIRVKDFTCDDFTNREEEMLQLLATRGPLVVAVDAVTWQDYLGGVIRFHCEAFHNHAVQIVGYDATGAIPYYIVRNSWGIDFGIDGYLYIAIGGNLCGIANEVSTLDALTN